jgi:BirA family transcriptional regulator, biotin operon repressor / biotin---[acetyl-CoA-carboxylase] ligase
VTTSKDLQRALVEAGIDAPARWLDVVGSTNSEASEWAASGAPEFALVAAGQQLAGRGRLGRTWQSVPGGSLTFSFVLRPEMEPEAAGLLTLLAGAALAQAARLLTGLDLLCKWPNDLVIGEAKAGGILCESVIERGSLSHVVVGIGVNLHSPQEVPGAIGIGEGVDPMGLLSSFLIGFRDLYARAGSDFAPAVLDAWRRVSATLGRNVEAKLADGSGVLGRAFDVDERGALVLETAGGLTTLTSGEVVHLR